MPDKFVDPFGAPEFLVDDIAFRSMVGTEYLRIGFYAQDLDEKILRVRLVFPLAKMLDMQAETRLFVMMQQKQKCVHQRFLLSH